MKELCLSEVRVLFQPIYEVSGGRHEIYGYESLLRVSGEETEGFIRRFYDEGRGREIELLSFELATRGFAERRLSGSLFINSLAYEVLSREEYLVFKGRVGPLCRDIVVENLETERYVDMVKLERKRNALWDAGFRIAADDYGVGINSMRAIRVLRPDIVKIDRGFVRGFVSNQTRRNLMEILFESIRECGARVLCEGVETWYEYEALRLMGADFLQGFYLGRPE